MKASLGTTNRRVGSVAVAKEITLQETQGLKVFLLRALVLTAGIGLFVYFISMQVRVNSLEKENALLADQVVSSNRVLYQTEAEYSSTITNLKSNIESTNAEIDMLNNQITSLKADNKSLAKEYDELLASYNILAERKELYDKYDYVVMYSGKRTDVTYDQIKSGEKIMLENNYDPDILFTTIMVESRGNEKVKNTKSTATGYGQFLYRTAKYVYEVLMGHGKGTYNHSMAKNGDLNMQMTAIYLSYLLDNNNGALFRSMKSYSGRDNSGTRQYLSWMNGFHYVGGL